MSRAPVALPNRQGAPHLFLAQNPRTLTHSQLFWLDMAAAFTAVAGERVSAFTETEGFDMLLRGAWTNMVMPRARFSVSGPEVPWENELVPLINQAGASDRINPMLYWRIPVLVTARMVLRADFINTGGEVAGKVNFIGEIGARDRQITISKSQDFWLLVDLGNTTVARTAQLDHDVLIWGATTNIASTSNLSRVFNESTNRAWSTNTIALRAVAGLEGQPQPIMWYRRPYHLPAYVQLRIEMTSAPAAGSYVGFIAERIFK